MAAITKMTTRMILITHGMDLVMEKLSAEFVPAIDLSIDSPKYCGPLPCTFFATSGNSFGNPGALYVCGLNHALCSGSFLPVIVLTLFFLFYGYL